MRPRQEEAYRELMLRPPDPRHLKLIRRGSLEDPRILGDKDFIEQTWRISGKRTTATRIRTGNVDVDIRETVLRIIDRFNALRVGRLAPQHSAVWTKVTTVQDLRSKSRKRPLPMLRALCVSHLAERRIATLGEAARFFGRGARSLSALRRRQYADLFKKYFHIDAAALFSDLSVAPDSGQRALRENLHGSSRNSRGGSML
jgi:hypothetical protein